MYLSDRCGGERGAVKALKHVVYLSAKPGPQHLLDLWPRNLRCVVLQAAELVNELGRQQVTTGCEDLPEFYERDAPVLERESQRPSERHAAVAGLQLGAASAPQVWKHAAAEQDPADLGVASHPPRPLAQRPDQVQRPGHRSARHQRLEDHHHQHPDQQRDRHPENHEPQSRQERPFAVVLGDRAPDRRDDR